MPADATSDLAAQRESLRDTRSLALNLYAYLIAGLERGEIDADAAADILRDLQKAFAGTFDMVDGILDVLLKAESREAA